MLKRLYVIVGFIFLALVLPAQAQHRNGPYYHHHHHGQNNWVVPFIIGGAVTYALTRPVPPPVVYQNNTPVIILQPGQQVVCGRHYQVFNSIQGIYETRQDCWIQ
jgi:hypothetical protein